MQTGCQGMENIAKFLNGQEGFNCKKGLVFVIISKYELKEAGCVIKRQNFNDR